MIMLLLYLHQVVCEPLGSLVRTHFVPIFSVCMAMRCSKKSGWEKGAEALQSSILNIANMSESERDRLIKKHLVGINFILNKYYLVCCHLWLSLITGSSHCIH